MADDDPAGREPRSRGWRAPPGEPPDWGPGGGHRRFDRRAMLGALAFAVVVAAGAGAVALTQRTPEPPAATPIPTLPPTLGVPPPREGAAMAYDPSTRTVLMFGGDEGEALLDDTWSWNGAGWSQLHPLTSPPALSQSMMAYDPQSHRLVLAAPTASSDVDVSLTWTWDGSSWTDMDVPLPATGGWSALATDTASGQLILVTGMDGGCQGVATWVWRQRSWSRLTPVRSPGPSQVGLLVYDPAAAELVLYTVPAEGCSGEGSPAPAVTAWSWNGAVWRQTGTMANASAGALDAVESGVAASSATGPVVVAGTGTYRWSASGWTEVSAAPGSLGTMSTQGSQGRAEESLAWDAANHQVVLFGGHYPTVSGGFDNLSDTWTWDRIWKVRQTGSLVAWTPAPTPPAPSCPTPTLDGATGIFDLHMETVATGWAQRYPDGAVLRTTDGGARWSVVSPPLARGQQIMGVAYIGAATARAISAVADVCPEPRQGTTVAVSSWATDDGGRSWAREGSLAAQQPANAGYLDFVDAEHGWFADAGITSDGSTSWQALFRTVDGGAHWQRLPGPTAGSSTASPGAGGPVFDSAAFIDAGTGWMCAFNGAQGLVCEVSHDGGASWAPQPFPEAASFTTGGGLPVPRFWSRTGGAMLVTIGSGTGSLLYMTRDGGATWTAQHLPSAASQPLAADFADPENGWLLTIDSSGPATPGVTTMLWITHDGGATWSRASAGGVSAQMVEVDFLNTRLGWGVSESGAGVMSLLRTTDGGAGWTVLSAHISG